MFEEDWCFSSRLKPNLSPLSLTIGSIWNLWLALSDFQLLLGGLPHSKAVQELVGFEWSVSVDLEGPSPLCFSLPCDFPSLFAAALAVPAEVLCSSYSTCSLLLNTWPSYAPWMGAAFRLKTMQMWILLPWVPSFPLFHAFTHFCEPCVVGRMVPKRCPCSNHWNLEYGKGELRIHTELMLLISWPWDGKIILIAPVEALI